MVGEYTHPTTQFSSFCGLAPLWRCAIGFGARMTGKLKLLAWSDSVLAATGFGTVSRHVLAELHKTGRYQIDQLAINYRGESFDANRFPYQLTPAHLLDPSDPFGRTQLIQALQRTDHDILWILNNTEIVEPVVGELEKLQAARRARGIRPLKIIYYYPVDSTINPLMSRIIALADAPVAYTEFGRRETLRLMPQVEGKLRVIYHGCDTQNFYPLGASARQSIRAQHLNIPDPSTYLIVNVNRNLTRKDMPRCILAYREFKKRVPNSRLYLHCEVVEFGVDLQQCCRALGLNNGSIDVVFPAGLRLINGGVPLEALNAIYNCADVFFTTTLGEGWGLTMTEAMSAGTPVIAPDNSSMPEILGGDRNRGYVYPCKEQVWVDHAYRPLGLLADIVAKLHECHEQRGTLPQREMIARAQQFAREQSWPVVCKNWVALFEDVMRIPG
jgi:glycosyltransferase involved in cell wall biosynthesis